VSAQCEHDILMTECLTLSTTLDGYYCRNSALFIVMYYHTELT